MKLFAKYIRDGNNSVSQHEGMSQEVVTSLLAELNCTDIQFIAEEEYNIYVQEHRTI